MILGLGILLAVSAAPQCASIEKEKITAADLAALEPAFSAMPAATAFGYAPAPGRSRVLGVLDLKAFADANGIAFTPTRELCFTWPVSPIDAQAAAAAMMASFPEATIEVIEVSRYPAPLGAPTFLRTGLQRMAAETMMWRGYVTYGEGRRFDIWARVKVTTKQDRVLATEPIRAGSTVRESQVRVQTFEGPPTENRYAATADQVVGRIAKTTVAAGMPIRNTDLAVVPEISRGDVVNVEVLNGAARISMEALAASTARVGESVELQNQSSGKTFRAKVSGMGRATVNLGRTQ